MPRAFPLPFPLGAVAAVAGVALLCARAFAGAPAPGCSDVPGCERLCRSGAVTGCREAGFSFLFGREVAIDLGKAEELLALGCERGDGNACFILANSPGQGGKERPPLQVSAILAMACKHGDASGCGMLSWNFVEGKGVPADPARAIHFAARSCELGSATSCFNLGLFLSNTSGMPHDLPRARQAFDAGCQKGSTDACEALETMRREAAAATGPDAGDGHAQSTRPGSPAAPATRPEASAESGAVLQGRMCSFKSSRPGFGGHVMSVSHTLEFDGRGQYQAGGVATGSMEWGNPAHPAKAGYGGAVAPKGPDGRYRVIGERLLMQSKDGSERECRLLFQGKSIAGFVCGKDEFYSPDGC